MQQQATAAPTQFSNCKKTLMKLGNNYQNNINE